jgi:glycosyltransferase involved in cell wall biosynthesis
MKVSICIITYNHEKYIKDCLENILKQKITFDIEIIVGEDESKDNTNAICKEYAKRYPTVIKIFNRSQKDAERKKYTMNALYNFIQTLGSCTGKYIALCEGDDYWTDENKLQQQIDFLEQNPDYVACFHNAQIETNGVLQDEFVCKGLMKDTYTIEDLLQGNKFPTASCVFRNVITEFPDWYKYQAPVGDWFLYLLLLGYGKAKYFPQVMSVYRIQQGGVHFAINNAKNKQVKNEKTAALYINYIKTFQELNAHYQQKYQAAVYKKILFWYNKLIFPYHKKEHFKAGKQHFIDSLPYFQFQDLKLYVRGFFTFFVPVLKWLKK